MKILQTDAMRLKKYATIILEWNSVALPSSDENMEAYAHKIATPYNIEKNGKFYLNLLNHAILLSF